MKKLLLLLLSCASFARAELVWKVTSVTIKAEPNALSAEAEFPFQNAGNTPVTLADVHASCGCTAAQPDKLTYAPGESGTIRARFDAQGRSGRQEKSITVTLSDAAQTRYTLQLFVDLPPAYTVTPRLLQWKIGATAEMKTVRFERNPNANTPLPNEPNKVAGFKIERVIIDQNTVEFRVTPTTTEAEAKVRLPLVITTGEYDGSGTQVQQRLPVLLTIH